MKVKELIENLGQYDGNLEVIIDGYEDGYEIVGDCEIITVKEYEPEGRRWFYGIYKDAKGGHKALHLVDREHPNGWDN